MKNVGSLLCGKYIIKGGIKENTVIKHFTSPRRHEMYAYGIDKARELCKF